MLVASLAEPALLMVFFTPAHDQQVHPLNTIVEVLAHRELTTRVTTFAGVAFDGAPGGECAHQWTTRLPTSN
jgi:hypothetical protein